MDQKRNAWFSNVTKSLKKNQKKTTMHDLQLLQFPYSYYSVGPLFVIFPSVNLLGHIQRCVGFCLHLFAE